MKICYLLESTELWGGVKVVFDQAKVLRRRGHDVSIRALGGNHSWYTDSHEIKIDYVGDLSAPFDGSGESKPDVVIATFWTTVEAAVRLGCSITLHLCQGYEGDYEEYADLRPKIERAYMTTIPKITVAHWLSDLLEKYFGVDRFRTYCVGQIVDITVFRPLPFWRRVLKNSRRKRNSVLIVGHYDVSFKGIPYALQAVALLKRREIDIRVIRVSPVDLLAKEAAITEIDEYHVHIPPTELADIYRRSNLFLSPSLSEEGFGLPLAEALACGVPSVATAIPSYLNFDRVHDYTCFVPERDPVAMADAAARVLRDKKLQRFLRKRGNQVVHRNFRSDSVAEKLEAIFRKSLL